MDDIDDDAKGHAFVVGAWTILSPASRHELNISHSIVPMIQQNFI